MADVRPTLLDVATLNGTDNVVGLIEEAMKNTPEVLDGPWRTIRGTQYKTRVRTALPSVGFRGANEGVDAVKSTFEQRLVETFILNARWECDKAVADAYEDGAASLIAQEALGFLEAAFIALGTQFYYGVAEGAQGFPGLVDVYDATNMLVKAGGTTATEQTSVWGVRWGVQDAQWVLGQGGEIDVSDVRTETVLDSDDKKFTAYVQELLSYPGLQVGSVDSVARIANIHPTDSSAALTDDDIATLLGKFPAGKSPDVLYMNRAALAMLRNSRTATNATGAPAPFPTEAFGVPIRITESITSTEAVVA